MSKQLRFGERVGKAIGDIGVFLAVFGALVLICICAGGCIGTIIEGFNSLMTGFVGR